ncbi:MAG: hypothetical protein C4520_16585 [Candidatus Abyssobacteria bacterium SURF_5]|uniref:Thioredoxin n=1 Tax=Abyssobacteria bacterium (strain SURF_5) TaxID=2093360 RepID=A0A3A4ND35_ABYX5|nr:MAG: hypothetical protein C4520_16585 [Candidatus Abyssubacteria bacterium SURF_5]
MTKIKSITTLFLLAICAISIYLIFSGGDNEGISAEQSVQSRPSNDALPGKDQTTSQDNSASNQIVASYFHGNRRCRTCLTIEAYTEEALKEKFAEELEKGKLVWRSIDITVAENKHFVNDYQLYAQSVVLSAVQDGKQTKWKNLDKVWQLVRNKQEFFSYIQTEAADFLKESNS